jgi:hypothetical protein
VARVGSARVSTTDQDLRAQIERLKAAGCEIIRSEKVTGTTRKGRSELASVLEFLRPGDELVVTRIDRLARSIGDLQDIVRELKRKGAFLRAADQPIDTSTAAGKAFLDFVPCDHSLSAICITVSSHLGGFRGRCVTDFVIAPPLGIRFERALAVPLIERILIVVPAAIYLNRRLRELQPLIALPSPDFEILP